MKHILIGIPCIDKPHMLTAQCLARMFYELGKARVATAIVSGNSSIISNARENIMLAMEEMEAKGIEFEYLFQIDSDMTFPPYVLGKLLSHQKDIVGCTYVRRSEPFDVLGRTINPVAPKNYDTGLIEMQALPTGILLVKRDVFRKFPKPIWRIVADESIGRSHGEDYYFCAKARELGYKIWLDVDLSKEIGHVSEKVLFPEKDGWSGSLPTNTPVSSAA